MNEKSDYFLKEFLKPIRATDDNLSIRLSILFTLKQIAPQKYVAQPLGAPRNRVLVDVVADRLDRGFLDDVGSREVGESLR